MSKYPEGKGLIKFLELLILRKVFGVLFWFVFFGFLSRNLEIWT